MQRVVPAPDAFRHGEGRGEGRWRMMGSVTGPTTGGAGRVSTVPTGGAREARGGGLRPTRERQNVRGRLGTVHLRCYWGASVKLRPLMCGLPV